LQNEILGTPLVIIYRFIVCIVNEEDRCIPSVDSKHNKATGDSRLRPRLPWLMHSSTVRRSGGEHCDRSATSFEPVCDQLQARSIYLDMSR